MKKIQCIVALAAAVCLLGGCGEGEKTVGADEVLDISTAPEKTVLVKVGDRAITVGDFRRRMAYETGVFSFTMKNAKQQPKDPEKRLSIFVSQRKTLVLPRLIHCALLDAYLDSSCGGRGVKDADKEIEKAVNRYLPKKKRAMGVEGLAEAIGTSVDYFKEQALVPAREDKAQLVFDPTSDKVTEKEIDDGLARMEAYTARAAASNRVIWASASNVLAQARSGADFAELGRKNGDAGEEGSEWGSFEKSELEGADLQKWAFSAKVGEVGGPFEVEDGLSVVKLLSRCGGTEKSSLASAQTSEATLARVNFRLINENPEPKTREHCRLALLNWKAKNAKTRLFQKLLDEAKIEYPNGKNFDFKQSKKQ